jgi:redox-sensing transcriptional repressor
MVASPTDWEASIDRGRSVCWKEEPVSARTSAESARDIPEATVARLPIYLRALTSLSESGTATCSSEQLAVAAGVNSAKLRKDLSYLGSYGTRGVGYDVDYLRYQIAREIGVTQDWPVVIVGIGNLGHALANYSGFRSRGFRVVALLDANPERHAETVAGVEVRPFDELERIVRENGVAIGVIATPAPAAQDVADRMVAAGVTSILNFAPNVLTVPEGVDVRKVDLSIELQILAYHEQRKAHLPGDVPADLPVDLPADLPGDLAVGLPADLPADIPGKLVAPGSSS